MGVVPSHVSIITLHNFRWDSLKASTRSEPILIIYFMFLFPVPISPDAPQILWLHTQTAHLSLSAGPMIVATLL